MAREIEIPPRKRPDSDDGYLEEMTKAIFQAGFSWQVVRQKWPSFQQAFDHFAIDVVAAYDAPDIERLLADPGIVRNGRKIQATIENARTIQALAREHGSFYNYLRSLNDLAYEQRRNLLTKRFKGLGRTSCFTFLWCIDEDVPSWEER